MNIFEETVTYRSTDTGEEVRIPVLSSRHGRYTEARGWVRVETWPAAEEESGLADLTVKELLEYANERDIDLNGVTKKKADILMAIEAAQTIDGPDDGDDDRADIDQD